MTGGERAALKRLVDEARRQRVPDELSTLVEEVARLQTRIDELRLRRALAAEPLAGTTATRYRTEKERLEARRRTWRQKQRRRRLREICGESVLQAPPTAVEGVG